MVDDKRTSSEHMNKLAAYTVEQRLIQQALKTGVPIGEASGLVRRDAELGQKIPYHREQIKAKLPGASDETIDTEVKKLF